MQILIYGDSSEVNEGHIVGILSFVLLKIA